MPKRIANKLKTLVLYILIAIMLTQSMAFAAAQPAADAMHHSHAAPAPLPEIEPFYIDNSRMWEPTYHTLPDPFAAWPDHDANHELGEVDQALVDRIQYEQANLWRQCPLIQDMLRFDELRNSSAVFSSLSEADRNLVLRWLDIPESDSEAALDRFMMMEQDGLNLTQSIHIMVIVSGGVFSYANAKIIMANMPCELERSAEITRFKRFIQRFDMPGNADALWLESSLASPAAISAALPAENNFYVAMQMFLDNRGMNEIEAAFAIEAALCHDGEIVCFADDDMEITGFGITPMMDTPTPDSIIYNPFALGFNANESVCLNTGASRYRVNILNIPGRGGFGFNLDK